MKKSIVIIVAFALISIPVAIAAAAENIESVPIPIDPKKIDLNGVWNYAGSMPTVTGKCPAGAPLTGTMKITQKGKAITLQYLSGAVCKPKSICTYTGDLNGNQLAVNNHAVVDDEGGNVTNALSLIVASNESANGISSSRYVHPKGMECHWESSIRIFREQKKKK